MTEPWGYAERNAYKVGLEEGKRFAAEETAEMPTLLDRFAMAALAHSTNTGTASYLQIAERAYDIANAMLYVRQKRDKLDDEIPF